MFHRILVPLDGSHNAYVALSKAKELAELAHAEIVLLNVVDSDHYSTYARDVNYYDIFRQMSDVGAKMLASAAKPLEAAGLKVQQYIVEGSPKPIIADTAPKKYDCDLIVIGKSGMNALELFLTGSTTAYVVRNSAANVLVINDDQDVDVVGY
ncbi:universal stress protein [Lacticaseibacillus sp. GG6-2]